MPELGALFLVAKFPHRAALARRVRDGSLFPALRHLEARGLPAANSRLGQCSGMTSERCAAPTSNEMIRLASVGPDHDS